MFGSRVEFSGTADRTAPFPVGSNPRWRPALSAGRHLGFDEHCGHFEKKTSNGHISVTRHPIYFVFGSRLGFFSKDSVI